MHSVPEPRILQSLHPPHHHHHHQQAVSSPAYAVATTARPSSPRRPRSERSRSEARGRPDLVEEHPPMRSISRPNMLITSDEYHSLPPSIQKKYFSSVERLRIAQQSAVLKRKKQHLHPISTAEPHLFYKSSMDFPRPRTAHSCQCSTLAQPRPSLSSTRTKRSDADVDEEQALRFLALPDKVKRSHFTQEELILLTESSERALGSPSLNADDASSSWLACNRKGSVCSSAYRSSTSDDYRNDDTEKSWLEIEDHGVNDSERPEVPEAELSKDAHSRRQGSVSSTLNKLPSMPPFRADARADAPRRSFSRSRALSLAPIPLPPPTLMPAVPPLPRSLSNANPLASTADSPSVPLSKPAAPPTEYYKDSQARRKLRDYLSSPEKFDEALEFGFPAKHDLPDRSASLSSNVEPGLQADIDSDEVSLTDSKYEEDDTHARSPRTLSVVDEYLQPGVGTYSSVDSGVALPFHAPSSMSIARGPSPDFTGREMTLRMTLTRPDLRAPEEELYAVQRKQVSGVDIDTSDPLALESLTICDDHTGAHGAFAVTKSSPGSFKKAWKNLCRR